MRAPSKSSGPSAFQAFVPIAQRGIPFITMGAQTLGCRTSVVVRRIDPFASQNFTLSSQPQAEKGLTYTRVSHSTFRFCVTTPPAPAAFPGSLKVRVLNRFGGGVPRYAANPGLTPSFRRRLPETGCLSQGLLTGHAAPWPCPPKRLRTLKLPTSPFPPNVSDTIGSTPLIDTVPDILARIVARKRADLARQVQPLEAWERAAELRLASRRDFRAALAAGPPAIIAEIKKASPSKGVLSHDFAPARIARIYESGAAAALSVLTDEAFFQGSLTDLEAARAAVSLPVLRKDFTIDAVQILEAAAHGADAILLIAAILSTRQIRDFREIGARYRLSALVEVHNRRELDAAIDAGADLIGVNNRNLATFEVTLDTSLALAQHMPPGALLVSESGIHDAADIVRLRAAGYHAFLVGEHLMKSGDPARALQKLVTP